MSRGYLVMGFGETYINECIKISKTIQVFDNNPVSILTQKKDEVYIKSLDSIFDQVIYVEEEDIKDTNGHNSFCVRPRVHMPKYLPYDETISLDSDMTCIYKIDHVWDFFRESDNPFMCCGYDYESCWHWGKVSNIVKKINLRIPSIHGGVLYFNKKNKNFDRFYELCLDAMKNYDSYGCLRSFRGGMTDEVIFSIAMAKLDLLPLNYVKYPIVSFNLPINTPLPAYVHSREGENKNKHIKTKYPTVFNHLFFHEKSMPKERQIKLEKWYNDFYKKINLMNKFVAVTAIYDIGRKDRNFNFYINNIRKLFTFKMPLVVFCGKSTYEKLKNVTRDHYIQFIVKELEELDFYKKHYQEIKNVISSKIYKKVKDYKTRPETIYPEYNIIQYSKFDFIEEVKRNINSEYYMWIDSGAPRFFNEIPKQIWPNYDKFNNKIIVQTFMVKEIKQKFNNNFNNSIESICLEQECKNSRYLIIGTNFVVPNKDVEWLKLKINEKYQEMINFGFLNNEQVAIEFVVKENIEMFDIKVNNSNNWYNMMNYI